MFGLVGAWWAFLLRVEDVITFVVVSELWTAIAAYLRARTVNAVSRWWEGRARDGASDSA